eukprot:233775_1
MQDLQNTFNSIDDGDINRFELVRRMNNSEGNIQSFNLCTFNKICCYVRGFVKKQRNQLSKISIPENKVNQINLRETPNERYSQLNMFSFGQLFTYGYEDENADNVHLDGTDKLDPKQNVFPKYASFKEELTQNDIALLLIDQYNNEYQKAFLRFTSHYCKKTFQPFSGQICGPRFKCGGNIGRAMIHHERAFLMEYVLAVIIYCNYDNLQFQFSKTYRCNGAQQHNNFYYLAKYLKICVHKWGMQINEGKNKLFYHGISEQLSFPACIRNLSIYCPLSTTTSQSVAINFANNVGLLVQFTGKFSKYFSCAWLSDFQNEKEFLFLQDHSNGLVITNITTIPNGHECSRIIQALHFIEEMTNYARHTPRLQSAEDEKLVKKIISEQLLSFPTAPTSYSDTIIHGYFHNKKRFVMHFGKFQSKYPAYFHIFCAQGWFIKLNAVTKLFPNIEDIELFDIKLSFKNMNQILYHLKKDIAVRIGKVHKRSILSYPQAAATLLMAGTGPVKVMNRGIHVLNYRKNIKKHLYGEDIVLSIITENDHMHIYLVDFSESQFETFHIMYGTFVKNNNLISFDTICNSLLEIQTFFVDMEKTLQKTLKQNNLVVNEINLKLIQNVKTKLLKLEKKK